MNSTIPGINPIGFSDVFGYHSNEQIKNKALDMHVKNILLSNELSQEDLSSLKAERKEIENNIEPEMKSVISNINLGKNIITIAGYIPIIGTIVAIAKLALITTVEKNVLIKLPNEMKKSEEDIQKYLHGQKIRSWIELTSLGYFLLIPDLIFTIGRNISKNSPNVLNANDN